MKQIAYNPTARFEYFILDKYEAGIVLEGAEVKSLRKNNCNMKDSFCYLRGGELWLKNMHIAVYDKSGAFSTKDSKRDRKLLMHRSEISRLAGQINAKRYTLVPLKIYFSGSLVKVEIALCRGKKSYDKRQAIAERDIKREAEREIKRHIF